LFHREGKGEKGFFIAPYYDGRREGGKKKSTVAATMGE